METTTDVGSIAMEKATQWLNSAAIDEATKKEIRDMISDDPKLVVESFYSDLEFGTGGLRGIMGPGTMRMNKYTVGMATQGLANYINKQSGGKIYSVAIAHDSRNQSRFFAETAAAILSANGIEAHLFQELRPTPLLSFAVRHLGCIAGIVITASHNPKEYNGYKVYWNDGAQVLPPHDKGIINEVRNVQDVSDIKFDGNSTLIKAIGPEVERAYYQALEGIIHSKDEIRSAHNLRIVYTSIHGTGITMVPIALQQLGFKNVFVVQEQATPDGNFTTVHSPNPEEKDAMSMALSIAEEKGADIVLGTDPDADRVGMAVRNSEGKLVLLNGNQAACLIVYYQLLRMREKDLFNGKQFIAKTIVTTDLLEEIAADFGVKCYNTLTGFKYIADVIREKEGSETFIAGGEESYGYSVGDFVRDKDAVLSSVVLSEIAAWCSANNKTVWELLLEIYSKYGLYHESLVSITMKGLDGIEQINHKMKSLRENPPQQLGGSPVVEVRDIHSGKSIDLKTGKSSEINLPASNVLQFLLEDGSKISARPSGTEPKIKFYFSLKEPFKGAAECAQQVQKIESRIKTIQKEIGL